MTKTASAALRVQGFAGNDQACPRWQLRVVDERGELDHSGAVVAGSAFAVERGLPHRFEAFDVIDGDLLVRAGSDEEPDVAVPARSKEAFGAAGRISSHHNVASGRVWGVAAGVTSRDLGGELRNDLI